ncbi:hypothetical protein LEP1GSC021_1575 [Leptospira noguchii str. 1993005606]|nr:hypothetical protein LEP1GSC021_1575 [Leptospira noguchii str. 1993005606]
MGRNSGAIFERLFSIRKTYFLQVKRLILVGTLEKYALILKSS